MNAEKQRIAIAEACGWKDVLFHGYHGKDDVRGIFNGQVRTRIPDYPNDLNACHEAVQTLNRLQLQKFKKHLQDVCSKQSPGKAPMYLQDYELIHATARQRAEAFLRTLGEWKD